MPTRSKTKQYLVISRKGWRKLPRHAKQQVLEQCANDPAIIKHYQDLVKNDPTL